jgi:histidinol dehydrogenase
LRGRQSGIVMVDDLDAAIEVANRYGAEHLEIQVAEPGRIARRVRHAGVIFLGRDTPVSLGDYCAGSNHVLPTGGTAAHASGLSVQTFLKRVQQVCYGQDALREVADHIVALSGAEDLPAHGQAVLTRFADGDGI